MKDNPLPSQLSVWPGILFQPPKERYRLVLDVTSSYAKCIGCCLNEYERGIVHGLVLKRLADEPIRVIIVARCELYNIYRAIIRYVDWGARKCNHTPSWL